MGLCHGKPTEPPQNLSEIHGENRAQNNNSSTGKTSKFPFYSPSPLPSAFKNSPANSSSVSSTPLRFFKRPFPPPSPAQHIKALLARRHGSVKPNEATIPEGSESEIVGLDKNFGFCKNFASHYVFGEEIGRGHFGYTSAAVGKKGALKGQDVAVKVIPKSKMSTAIAIEDVRREVKMLRALTGHKNLVQFYEAYEDEDNVYVVMELCKGGELLDRILSRGGKYPEEDAKIIMVQILNVIAYCHLQGVVHRDLKPEILKTRGLLLDGSDDDHVIMHDVARDVSIFIASQERRVKCNDCTWISSHVHGGAKLNDGPPPPPPHEPFFPDLKLLFMNDKVEKEEEMEMNEHNLVGGSTKLNVLFIEYGLLKSLPLIINLTTLVLHHCESLESLADVAQMKNLEILVCRSCNSIKELPEQVRGLKRLKLLEISACYKLERVAAGVISSMVALEELEIVRSFKNWKGGETEDEGKEAAGLRELESLKKLRCLDIDVSDIGLAAQPLHLLSPDLLVQFRVRFGNKLRLYDLPEEGYQRRMSLDFGAKNYIINLGDLSKNIFLTHSECLFARGDNQDFSLNLAAAQGIRWLTLKRFENKKNIASAAAAFPLLEYLSLDKMHKLEEIWDDDAPTPSNSFTNLKELRLVNLHSLKRMGKSALSTAKDFFLQLETIEIKKCKEMEHLLVLVPGEEQDEEDGLAFSFPKLKILRLCELPKLRSICSSGGIKSIQFPLLAHMEIRDCNNLKCFVSRDHDDEDRHYRNGDDSLHLFCHPKVTFGKLKILSCSGTVESNNVWTFWCDKVPMDFFRGLEHLKISNYEGIRRLFPSSKIPQNLVNLQTLVIDVIAAVLFSE